MKKTYTIQSRVVVDSLSTISTLFKKKSCQKNKSCIVVQTCSDCEQEVIRVDECGCRKRSCEGVVLKDCKPKKPPVDKCHNDPVRYPTGEISASENGCINCHRWNVTQKYVPDTNKCHLEHLPKKCRSDFTEKGTCTRKKGLMPYGPTDQPTD